MGSVQWNMLQEIKSSDDRIGQVFAYVIAGLAGFFLRSIKGVGSRVVEGLFIYGRTCPSVRDPVHLPKALKIRKNEDKRN